MSMNRSRIRFDGQILAVRELYVSAQVSPHILLEGNSRRPDLFSTFLILGFSAVHPVFEDVDITGYKQIGGIALSFVHAVHPYVRDIKLRDHSGSD